MRYLVLTAAILGGVLCAAGTAGAQQAAPYPLDVIPEKMSITPYGAPITLERARAVIHAALAEAAKRGWAMNIAVLDSGGNLVAFERMDGAQLGSISIAEHKARAAVKFRRPTKVFEDAIQKSGYNYYLTLEDVIASRGGIPLVENGKLIGAVGVSGGAGSQDEVVATAGAAVVNK